MKFERCDMDKQEFIAEVKPILKARGYKKNGQYWYKKIDKCIAESRFAVRTVRS